MIRRWRDGGSKLDPLKYDMDDTYGNIHIVPQGIVVVVGKTVITERGKRDVPDIPLDM